MRNRSRMTVTSQRHVLPRGVCCHDAAVYGLVSANATRESISMKVWLEIRDLVRLRCEKWRNTVRRFVTVVGGR
jgi:uncharacterized membrane protein YcgQ (UPF0703/DUF1980 family)